MIRTPLRPLARILKARERGEDTQAIEAENLRLRHEAMRDHARLRAEGRLLVLGAMFAIAFGTIGMRMGALAGATIEEPQAAARGNPIIGQRGDITDKDAFIYLRTGAHTMHPVPFANSDLKDSSRDGQFYRMRDQHLDEYQLFAFAGKVHYRVLDPKSNTLDCAWCCGSSYGCHVCC